MRLSQWREAIMLNICDAKARDERDAGTATITGLITRSTYQDWGPLAELGCWRQLGLRLWAAGRDSKQRGPLQPKAQ